MSFLNRISECNHYNLDHFLPFLVEAQQYGWVRPEFAKILAGFPDAFQITEAGLEMPAVLGSPGERTLAAAEVMETLHSNGTIDTWVGESYPVVKAWGDRPQMYLERAAAAYMGVKAFGVHVNGLVIRQGELHLWVATRAKDKPTFPGMLDHIAAGGQPAGLSLELNVIKECLEEAAIPADISSEAELVSEIEYCMETRRGLRPDTIFVFDLELSDDFTPYNTDGEVESFELMSIEEVAEIVMNTCKFKPNCNLVIIDLLMRKGFIPQDWAEEHGLSHLLRQTLEER